MYIYFIGLTSIHVHLLLYWPLIKGVFDLHWGLHNFITEHMYEHSYSSRVLSLRSVDQYAVNTDPVQKRLQSYHKFFWILNNLGASLKNTILIFVLRDIFTLQQDIFKSLHTFIQLIFTSCMNIHKTYVKT